MGEELGGFRTGGYQRHLKTPGFRSGIERLETVTARGRTAVMCAEAVWLRCHRRFIAREMTARGYPVGHIVAGSKTLNLEPLPLQRRREAVRQFHARRPSPEPRG